MTTTDASRPELAVLLDVLVDDAKDRVRRLDDRSINQARELVARAEEQVADLEGAARELGRVRGSAAEDALHREADAEIDAVFAGAFERLFERFQRRVRLALEGLREGARYAPALAAWARAATEVMDRPVDVYAAPEDLEMVYDAFLAAGAQDWQVRRDRSIHIGFVVRDLDGRTVLDRRPGPLVEERADALRELLKARVPDIGPTPPALEPGTGD